MHSEYLTSAAKKHQLPPPSLPETAFVGRSNCGKSSLLNALLNRKDLARTSRTPGRTQMINFFTLNDTVMIVDTPGYGYSATGSNNREEWQDLVTAYFDRPNIKNVLFLSDIRRKLDKDDLSLIKFLKEKVSISLILTKADKLSRQKVTEAKLEIMKELEAKGVKNARIYTVSSQKGMGISDLRNDVLKLKT